MRTNKKRTRAGIDATAVPSAPNSSIGVTSARIWSHVDGTRKLVPLPASVHVDCESSLPYHDSSCVPGASPSGS